jgi:hypothetical protein
METNEPVMLDHPVEGDLRPSRRAHLTAWLRGPDRSAQEHEETADAPPPPRVDRLEKATRIAPGPVAETSGFAAASGPTGGGA